jgi:hypothetical protein
LELEDDCEGDRVAEVEREDVSEGEIEAVTLELLELLCETVTEDEEQPDEEAEEVTEGELVRETEFEGDLDTVILVVSVPLDDCEELTEAL